MTNMLTDDIDMKRQVQAIYVRGNTLINKFRNCSDEVKLKLFKTYCNSFYCSNLWYNFSKTMYRKVKSVYNRVFGI